MGNNKLEAVLLHIISLLKLDIEDYCDIETIDGARSIVTMDGSMATIVLFNGTKSILGREQFERFIKLMNNSLSVYFQSRGHQLQIVFYRDLDARAPLEKNANQQHATADRLQLAVHHLIDESVDKYCNYVYDEICYLVFWSRPALLDSSESNLAHQATNEFRKENKWPSTKNAQNLLRPISYLKDRHNSFVSKVCDDLSSPEFGCSIEILDVADAIRAIKQRVQPDYTAANWVSSIPGTTVPFRWKKNDKTNDLSEVFYPTLASQIMTSIGEIGSTKNPLLPDPTTIRIGSRAYAPLVLDIPPREPQYFNSLFNSLNRAETRDKGVARALPYSISFMLESDGMSILMFKSIFASLLSITSEQNRNINLAVRALQEYRRDGGCIVKLRIAAMTWSNTDPEGIKELTLRKSKLWRTLEGWGNPRVIERTGNAMLAFQTNALALTTKHISNPAPAPLEDAIALLPLTRPASPFSTGSTIYRSLDGKILNYQRFSSEQTTWISLIAGKPGSGKSVLMNNNNVECCLMPGLTRLPYIGIIDIGVSSSGFIQLIRDNLPEHLQHLAVYKRLQNSTRDCINPLDMPLGNRYPLPKDREFIKNFLSILVTPPERRDRPYEGMSNFVGRMIDMAYERKSDRLEKATPETYKPGHNEIIDNAVQKINYHILPATTYWELVDALFSEGYVYEAEIAQRYAVPTLDDLVAVASSEEVEAEYGDTPAEGNRSLIKTFSLGVREAIADFPIFSSHTQFDIGSARIISLDLQDVATIGSDAAYKQTALMYMIARQSFMKKVAFSKEDMPYFQGIYSKHYEKLIDELVDENKVLCMDEYHKTGGHDGLTLQVMTDGREARKWNLEIILASQLMKDFGELTQIATSIFILDAGTEKTRQWLKENIGLSDVEESALTNYVHGANAHGATFLARFETKNATYSQLFTMTAGPMRLWALSTTAEDRKLRDMLYQAMPRPDALKMLAKHFPSGGCKKLVERLKQEMFADAEFIDDDMESSIVERISKDIIKDYYSSN